MLFARCFSPLPGWLLGRGIGVGTSQPCRVTLRLADNATTRSAPDLFSAPSPSANLDSWHNQRVPHGELLRVSTNTKGVS